MASERISWIGHILPMFERKLKELGPNTLPVELFNLSKIRRDAQKVGQAIDVQGSHLNKCFSPDEVKIIKAFLAHPIIMDTNSVEDLKKCLQIACEVEIATLPPYLTAMYSISGASAVISGHIKDVVLDEMKHLGLAANMLISIGGSPDCLSDEVKKQFPKPLPAGLAKSESVPITKLTKDQLASFMLMELPIVVRQAECIDGFWTVDCSVPIRDEDSDVKTIGEFYDCVLESFRTLHEEGKIVIGNEDRQVSYGDRVPIDKISSMEDVVAAINTIKNEGEGNGKSENGLWPYVNDPSETEDLKLAHYFKYAEMFYGKRISLLPGHLNGFRYDGEEVDLDALTIANMRDNPTLESVPDGEARDVSLEFASYYRTMLCELNDAFNGNPEEGLDAAVLTMRKMATPARKCMSTAVSPTAGDVMVGLSWEPEEQ